MQRSPWGVGRPTFRTVWSRRREAGLAASRTGCRMIISGRTGGDTSAKSFYFSPWRIEARSDTGVAARHNVGLPPPDGSIRLFFLPRLSFSRTKKKDGVRAPHWCERDAGYYPAYQRNPDRAFRPKRPSISAARRSPACLGDNTPIVHGIPLGRWFPPDRR